MSNEPWLDEPVEIMFLHSGYRCAMLRRDTKWIWRGYVGIGSGHPLFGADYDDVDVSVHGGLTYSDNSLPNAEPDGLWWFGFDCGHAYDLFPAMQENVKQAMGDRYDDEYDRQEVWRDQHFTRKETESLAEQLKALENGDVRKETSQD